ncbi:MAG: hypothetical protein GTN78_20795 [Gemmatimonadales bacterium]|nr:hypothetical protein [Gemmatimonadales bacterium]NIN10121.1 hypothetical protein [Gemmatimonadales bacterium]NIR02605.1 hypothetical protein [Gemmatimonadales bacterium]NIS66299.1 hypothetical protein [Gemmatimonadales bacterium]
MRSWLAVVLPAVLAFAPFTSVLAQEQSLPLEPGQRVRVTAPNLRMRHQLATFEALRGDTLVVTADSTMYCPLASVTRFEVDQGRKSEWKTGLIVGAFVGAIGGGIAGYVIEGIDDYSPEYPLPVAGGALAGAAVMGGLGAGIGAFIKTDRWEEIPLDRLRVSLVPRPDGRFGLSLSLRF